MKPRAAMTAVSVAPVVAALLRTEARGGAQPANRALRSWNPHVRGDQRDPLLLQLTLGSGFETVEFLGALNDDGFDKRTPARVPSGLRPGGNIKQ